MQRYKTKYGTVRKAEGCKDDYDNIVLYDQPGSWAVIKLQSPAMQSLKAVEERWAKVTTPWKKRRHIRVSGTWRSCELQAQLYNSDRSRYAPPQYGLHMHGLAIDVYWKGVFTKLILKRILKAHGWNQSRPDDEPWHWSYHLTA